MGRLVDARWINEVTTNGSGTISSNDPAIALSHFHAARTDPSD
jgi:hypothetical protein